MIINAYVVRHGPHKYYEGTKFRSFEIRPILESQTNKISYIANSFK